MGPFLIRLLVPVSRTPASATRILFDNFLDKVLFSYDVLFISFAHHNYAIYTGFPLLIDLQQFQFGMNRLTARCAIKLASRRMELLNSDELCCKNRLSTMFYCLRLCRREPCHPARIGIRLPADCRGAVQFSAITGRLPLPLLMESGFSP
jgi:hypothetical protein